MSIRVVGVGKAIPGIDLRGEKVNNEQLLKAIEPKGKDLDPAYLKDKLGIESRYLMSPPDQQTGKPANPESIDETEMAAVAARDALKQSELTVSDIDALYYITATTNPFFNQGIKELSRKLGLDSANSQEMNVGCGGVGVAMTRARKRLRGSHEEAVMIVASHAPSQHINRDLYAREDQIICEEIFGDGAGAMILEKKNRSGPGIERFYHGEDNEIELMRADIVDGEPVYYIHGRRTAVYFRTMMRKAYDGLNKQFEESHRVYHGADSDIFLTSADNNSRNSTESERQLQERYSTDRTSPLRNSKS